MRIPVNIFNADVTYSILLITKNTLREVVLNLYELVQFLRRQPGTGAGLVMAAGKKAAVTKRGSAKGSGEGLNFLALVLAIQRVHAESATAANRAVNTSLTLRN